MRLTWLLCICLGAVSVWAWPDGAPCSDHVMRSLKPQHQGGTLERAPFKLRVRAACYEPGRSLQVELRVKGGRRVGFRGFLLQARPAGRFQLDAPRLGFFLDAGDAGQKWRYQCPGDKTSVTHIDRENKQYREFYWTAASEVGSVRFVATVVQSYSTFYVGTVVSRIVPPCSQLSTAPIAITTTTTTQATTSESEASGPSTGGFIQTIPLADGEPEDISFADEDDETSEEGFGAPKLSLRGLEAQLAKSGERGLKGSSESREFPALPEAEESKEEEEEKKELPLCEQPAHPGEFCEPGYQHLWYYHKGFCFRFWYSGCEGNANRFYTKTACLKACHPNFKELGEGAVSDPRENCALPADEGGFCPGRQPQEWLERWAFVEGACRPFFYAGCYGNPNRFESPASCEKACGASLEAGGVPSECRNEEDLIEHCGDWIRNEPGYCDALGEAYRQQVADYCQRSCCLAKAQRARNL